MSALIWSIVLSVIGVLGAWLAGNKSWVGWAIGLFVQVLWAIYAVATGQYGFLIGCVAFGFIYARNLRAWTRPEGSQPPI